MVSCFLALVAGCSAREPSALATVVPVALAPKVPGQWPATSEGKRVLVLWNKPNPEGEKLAMYYASKRGVPKENVLRVIVDAGEDTNANAVEQGIFPVISERVKTSKDPIDYIVLVKGMPIRYFDATNFCYSLDAIVATMNLKLTAMREPKREQVQQAINPYFGKDEPFSRAKFGFFLVTRLDGYTYADAQRLVDSSVAAKPEKGPFFLDANANTSNDGYGAMNKSIFEANNVLSRKGFNAVFDRTTAFKRPDGPVMGYCSWGSNDAEFSAESYRSIQFKPGAIAETFVSTSGRTMKPVTSGQSVITDLIRNGLAGVKGYVMEPYTLALARPNILFDRYTSGYNLAESFYMASPVLKWRDMVFGDPLCRPYKK